MPFMFLEKLHDKKALAENLSVFQDEKVILSDDKGSIILKNIVSVEVFRQAGYDGVMDYQLIMLDKIYGWLKEKESLSQTVRSRFSAVIIVFRHFPQRYKKEAMPGCRHGFFFMISCGGTISRKKVRCFLGFGCFGKALVDFFVPDFMADKIIEFGIFAELLFKKQQFVIRV